MGETGSGIQVRYSVSVNRECVFFDDISRILFRSCQLLILCFFFQMPLSVQINRNVFLLMNYETRLTCEPSVVV